MNLSMILLLQATLIGPPDTAVKTKKPNPEAAKTCEDTQTDEIIVCAQSPRGEIVTNQRVGPIKPPTQNPLTRSENGLVSRKIGKDAVVDGAARKEVRAWAYASVSDLFLRCLLEVCSSLTGLEITCDRLQTVRARDRLSRWMNFSLTTVCTVTTVTECCSIAPAMLTSHATTR